MSLGRLQQEWAVHRLALRVAQQKARLVYRRTLQGVVYCDTPQVLELKGQGVETLLWKMPTTISGARYIGDGVGSIERRFKDSNRLCQWNLP